MRAATQPSGPLARVGGREYRPFEIRRCEEDGQIVLYAGYTTRTGPLLARFFADGRPTEARWFDSKRELQEFLAEHKEGGAS